MYTTGGYQCGVCGVFVMHNSIHICGGTQQPSIYPPQIPAPPSYFTVTVGNTNQDNEIIDKLNKIIEILKTIQRRAS